MKKADVLNAFAIQKANCIQAFPSLSSSWIYFTNIEAAIEEYYASSDGVAEAFRAVIRGMFTALSKAKMKCKNDDALGISYPEQIKTANFDWYEWEWLNDDLAAKIEYTAADASTGSTENTPSAEQPALAAIISEIKSARTLEVERFEVLAEAYWSSNSKSDLICLLEDRGEVLAIPDKKEIAKEIYVDGGILKQIQDNGLDVHIPTYLR